MGAGAAAVFPAVIRLTTVSPLPPVKQVTAANGTILHPSARAVLSAFPFPRSSSLRGIHADLLAGLNGRRATDLHAFGKRVSNV
jgi:hypothetical protein